MTTATAGATRAGRNPVQNATDQVGEVNQTAARLRELAISGYNLARPPSITKAMQEFHLTLQRPAATEADKDEALDTISEGIKAKFAKYVDDVTAICRELKAFPPTVNIKFTYEGVSVDANGEAISDMLFKGMRETLKKGVAAAAKDAKK